MDVVSVMAAYLPVVRVFTAQSKEARKSRKCVILVVCVKIGNGMQSNNSIT